MDKGQFWDNFKKYAGIFFQGVGMVFAYIFHYLGVFGVFVYKKAKILFKKLRRFTRKLIRKIKKHLAAGDPRPPIYTLLVIVLVIVLFCLLIHGISSGKKEKKNETPAPAAPVQAPAPATVTEDNGAIVAAIVAAIAVYEEKSPESFRVVSFKKRI